MWYSTEAYKNGLLSKEEDVNPYSEPSLDFYRWQSGKDDGIVQRNTLSFVEAIGTVWRMAERKHQEECYEDVCTYCEALTIVAKKFPEIESSRAEYYRDGKN